MLQISVHWFLLNVIYGRCGVPSLTRNDAHGMVVTSHFRSFCHVTHQPRSVIDTRSHSLVIRYRYRASRCLASLLCLCVSSRTMRWFQSIYPVTEHNVQISRCAIEASSMNTISVTLNFKCTTLIICLRWSSESSTPSPVLQSHYLTNTATAFARWTSPSPSLTLCLGTFAPQQDPAQYQSSRSNS
jgi:hypothetical protein